MGAGRECFRAYWYPAASMSGRCRLLSIFVMAALLLPGVGGEARAQVPEVAREAEPGRVPESAAALRDLAERRIASRDFAVAAAAAARAVALEPGSAAAHALLGRALALDRRFQQGVAHLERALALGDPTVATRLYLGAALWEAGDPAAAERVFRDAVEMTGGAVQPLQQLGRLLLWQGRHAEALPLLERAAALAPDAPELQLELARAYQESGRAAEAVAVYRRLVGREPELKQARYALGLLLQRTGDAAGARRELAEYARLLAEEKERTHREGQERARLDLGWRLLREERAAEALAHFRALPAGWEALAGQAAALRATGDHAGAARALEGAVLLAPERAELRQALAEARAAAESRP
jgi:tetratricopeptide (TPR) repeat protein